MSFGTQAPQERKLAPAETLPAELLDHIFHYVYEDFKTIPINQEFERGLTRPEIGNFNDNPDDPVGAAERDRLEVIKFTSIQPTVVSASAKPKLFPYALAAVCPSWEAALSLSPEFWTRLVLFMDSSPASLARARKYIAWSEQLPIDVFLQHGKVASVATEREALTFLNTSLPTLHAIPCDATALRSVYITSILGNLVLKEDQESFNGGSESSRQGDDRILDEPSESEGGVRLQTMKIDTQTFEGALANPPSWFRHQPQLRHLNIEEHARDHPRIISLNAALHTISTALSQSLTSITMQRLGLFMDMQAPRHTYQLDHVRALFFRSMDASIIAEIFTATLMPQLTVLGFHNCCKLRPMMFRDIETEVGALILDNYGIPPTTTPATTATTSSSNNNNNNASNLDYRPLDLVDFISGWSGTVLAISHSDMCLDKVMTLLARGGFDLDEPAKLLCYHMQKLILDHCRTPSFASVKRMIEVRNASVDYEDPLWKAQNYDVPVVFMMSFDNCHGPMWSREEIEWVRSRVWEFKVT